MQLSRSYVIAYADSNSNGIIWNIETSFNIEKFSTINFNSHESERLLEIN